MRWFAYVYLSCLRAFFFYQIHSKTVKVSPSAHLHKKQNIEKYRKVQLSRQASRVRSTAGLFAALFVVETAGVQ